MLKGPDGVVVPVALEDLELPAGVDLTACRGAASGLLDEVLTDAEFAVKNADILRA